MSQLSDSGFSLTKAGAAPFLFLVFVSLFTSCSNRLGTYEDIQVGKPAATASKPEGNQVAITYLGTNGYLIQSGNTAIVVDPYFTRTDLRRVMFNAPMTPNDETISWGVEKAGFPRKVDAWLVTHSHFDHLLDVPPLQERFGGTVVTSRTGKFLCEAAGVPKSKIHAAQKGDQLRFGNAQVSVLAAAHDRVFGQTPYPGLITEPLQTPPSKPKDWKLGTPLAFVIEIGGKRIYVESGGIRGHLPDVKKSGHPIDLAILGVAVKDSQQRYPDALSALDPRYVLPSHQDDFFQPLSRGFAFGATANFPKVIAAHRKSGTSAEMIVMDFFSRWILE